MTRALLGLMIVAGCAFEPGTHPDMGGGDDDGMGGGSGGGSQGGPDTDNDGVADLTDNCPMVGNVEQHDHDDDARGDACDVCPHLVEAGKDSDMDGVGDACDPRPTEPGERLAFFEGFYGSPSWKPVVGANNWMANAGTLRLQSTDGSYQLVRDDTPNLTAVFVDARVRINAIANNNSMRRSTGIVLSYRDPNHYVFCGLAAAQSQGTEVNAGQVTTDWFGNAQYNYNPGTFPGQMAGDWLTLQARTSKTFLGATKIDCATHRSGVTGEASFEGGAEIDGDVGIRTNSADASFDYVFVVATPASSS
jgi:hypothetical protein